MSDHPIESESSAEHPPQHLAAVDIGTNSLHLVIARITDGGRFEPVEREKEMVRLGSGGGDMRELAPDAIDRAVEALGRYRQLAESRGATLRAVATSAVREAENRDVLLQQAQEEAGVTVEVISGPEEARLIHLGVLQALPLYDRRHLVIDIGGGSTEVVVGEGDDLLLGRSLKLGAIRLTEAYLLDEPLEARALERCRRHVRTSLSVLAGEVRRLGFEVAAGSSGTIESVAAIVHDRRDRERDRKGRPKGEPPRTLSGLVMSAAEVAGVVELLADAATVEERRTIEGLDARRADIILAGAVVLEEAMSLFAIDELVVSDGALREGVLLDTLERSRGMARHHLRDVRRRSVLHLAELCDPDLAHSSQVAHLALAMFDGTAARHGLGDDERELLEAAALLANVGLFVSHDSHHKHSYYVIRNTEHLAGFTDREVETIALVARYHRKSHPRRSHPEFKALDADRRRTVQVLAGLLRIAIGLDRTHEGRVRGVEVDVTSVAEEIDVAVEPADGADITLELYSAQERAGLLTEILGCAVAINGVVSPASG